MNGATDTIIITGPAKVVMIGMTYQMGASVAPEALHSSKVIFSKNSWYV